MHFVLIGDQSTTNHLQVTVQLQPVTEHSSQIGLNKLQVYLQLTVAKPIADGSADHTLIPNMDINKVAATVSAITSQLQSNQSRNGCIAVALSVCILYVTYP